MRPNPFASLPHISRPTTLLSKPFATHRYIPVHLLSTTNIPFTSVRPIATSSPKRAPPTPPAPTSLPHLTPTSEIHLISTSTKSPTHRRAIAIGNVRFSNPDPLRLIHSHGLKKGDVLAVARIAGIQAVKNTSAIIPLAHPGLPVEGCIVRVEPVHGEGSTSDMTSNETNPEAQRIEEAQSLTTPIGEFGGVRISVDVETTAKTGVEMEALTGVVGAALTVVDMCKSVDKGCVIEGVEIIGKKGGRSGGWGVWADVWKESD